MEKANIIKKVQKFQEELDRYYKETDCGIPDIECTYISESIITYKVNSNKVTRTEVYDRYDRFEDVYRLSSLDGQDDLLEQIKYDRRRLNKGWRVWRSENPDAEMEIDED